MFSKGDDGLRRSNPIGEVDSLKQKKQTKVEHISRLYTVDWADTNNDWLFSSRLIRIISRLMEVVN